MARILGAAIAAPADRYAPPDVAEFLSESWIVELDHAARDALSLTRIAPVDSLVVEQRVRRGDDEVVYHLTFGPDGARVGSGPAAAPDLVLATDVVTARALQAGTLNAQQAALAGRLKIGGDLRRLRASGEALRSVDDVFHAVREATTYPEDREVNESHP